MNIDIISDIHLEVDVDIANDKIDKLINILSLNKKSNIICLLGDIGIPDDHSYEIFLKKILELYEYVLLVTGNHEYYTLNKKTPEQVEEHINIICKKLNIASSINNSMNRIYFLQKDIIEIGDYVFAGCTLWSHIEEKYFNKVINYSNNYSMIWIDYNWLGLFKSKRQITPDDTNRWHEDHLNWFKTQVIDKYKNSGKKIIMLTHYPPLDIDMVVGSKGQHDFSRCLYGTDLSILFDSCIAGWLYGHTHVGLSYPYRKNLRLQSNPIDYNFNMNIKNILKFMHVTLT